MSITAKNEPANERANGEPEAVASGDVPLDVPVEIPAEDLPAQPPGRRTIGEIRSPSLDDLIVAYNEEGTEAYRPRFETLRGSFERSQDARIEEQYFTPLTDGAAVLLREDGTGIWKIKFSYDSGIASPGFDEVMCALHSEQLQSSILLRGLAQHIVVQRIYAVISNLLSVLDSCHGRQSKLEDSERAKRLTAAVESGRKELTSIREFVRQSTRRQAIGRYLLGFPIGIVVAALAVLGVAAMSFTIGESGGNGMLAVCLGAGAIGAVISVMARITGGKQLDIDSDQSKLITMLAGAFRPVVGAVFGAVLYALILGGLLPLDVPDAGGQAGGGAEAGGDIRFFFAAVAFLAGFSERWAQDTIVQSTPGTGRAKRGAPKPAE